METVEDPVMHTFGDMVVPLLKSSSNLIFGETQELTNNLAGYGGAIYFTHDSKIYLRPYTSVYFKNNFAQYHGGALFVEDNPFTYCILDSDAQVDVQDVCFIHQDQSDCTPLYNSGAGRLDHSISLDFQDNAAKETGSVLYGGNLDSCTMCFSNFFSITGGVAFNTWANISNHSLISSDPYRICSGFGSTEWNSSSCDPDIPIRWNRT